jgi:divalent metal cation (Fe/Co/Zn/Cd) transporter
LSNLTQQQSASREKTLRAAFLLSSFAPLTTGLAVLMSTSITQVADFIRRTVELVALLISWLVFRYLQKKGELSDAARLQVERVARLSVAGALGLSGLVMLFLTLTRLNAAHPGGNVSLGLTIASLGLLTNAWFWRRYARMTRESFNAVIASQVSLYRAKSAVDLCVIAALAAVAIQPLHPATRLIDLGGSLAVAGYLLWSSSQAARQAQAQTTSLGD